ncbi:MAG: ADP-ribosylglycohydrolase family protein [Levilactobacillus sp.]|jgi:ADP-ribosylglycohydrolase|nr:ADP-ribosylglycohydrolase family protein [Levilactobacillus sp.]
MKSAQILTVLRTAAVADALGVPAEMKARGSYQLTGMTGYGSWPQPAGSWSDDTSMTLCLLQNILEAGSDEDLLDKFEHYMMSGEWTPRGITFGVGRTCAHAVRQHAINHVPAQQCGDAAENANGNGALMRIAPLAFVLAKRPVAERFATTKAYTTVTHGHPRAVVGSFIYLELLHELLAGQDLMTALTTVKATLTGLNPATAFAAEVPAYQRLFTGNFQNCQLDDIHTSPYVVDTLEAAVWVALTAPDLRSGLLRAVNLGGDVDTIATVAAPLLAMSYSEQTVSAEWWQTMINRPLLDQVMVPFAQKFGD